MKKLKNYIKDKTCIKVRYIEDNQKRHVESVLMAIQELKKRMKKDGILQDLRIRESYMSPSKKRRFKKNEAIKRRKREETKHDWYEKNKSNNEF